MRDELSSLLTFVLDLLRDYAWTTLPRLSTKTRTSTWHRRVWEEATRTLEE